MFVSSEMFVTWLGACDRQASTPCLSSINSSLLNISRPYITSTKMREKMHEACGLCGFSSRRGLTADTSVDSKRIFSEREDWDADYKKLGYVVGKTEELENMYFRFPWMWDRLYRAIIRTPPDSLDGEFTYRLTGVSLSGDWNYNENTSISLYFPSDPEQFILGSPTSWPEIPTPVEPATANVWRPVAYEMHDRCWVVATRIVDFNLIMQNVDLFSKSLLLHADDHIRAVTIDEQRYWREPAKQYEDLVWTDPGEYAKVCEKRMHGCFELASAPRDPFNIPELRDLLNQPEKLHRPKTKKQKEREMERTESAVGRMALKPYLPRRYQSQSNCKVPTEIILIIMEYLDEYPDIFGLIRVFPQYRPMISRAAWRRKCIDVLLLEEPLPSAADLDWSYLYFNIGRLLRKSHGWMFRGRVLSSLEERKEVFLTQVDRRFERDYAAVC